MAAFTAHEKYVREGRLLGLDVVPFERIEERYPPDAFALFVAIGYARANKARAQAYSEAKGKGYDMVSYVSSTVTQWGEVNFGDNCFVLDHTVIQPFTHIGNDVVIGLNSVIGHDVRIGDHCFIGPGAVIAGDVAIGPYCFIGANATIKNSVTIAAECMIGAGAIILKDTREREVYLARGTQASPVSSADFSPFLGMSKSRRH